MVPMMGNAPSLSPAAFRNTERIEDYGIAYGMGLTAEKVAQQWKVSRADQDAFALQSHQRALAAQAAGEIADVDPEVAAWALMGVGEMIGMRYVLWPTGETGAFGSGATSVPEHVFEEMVAFVQRVHRDLPKTTVEVISIKPSPSRAR